ncbi:superoxide dismutase family protein [Streptomyces sp. TRM66268-LWL]|uniref:Superoxide dismutase family protein n=1 Tax=Streptomyces polyasparticus TaxID=2767826 RepID=A0ABR7SAN6_9ACTN|nr:superoxide dismutase family protein [Streptomyces polyasparticus]MBC9712551.1 superoxide dismutase family protein [Streptomyces polyasparticus]
MVAGMAVAGLAAALLATTGGSAVGGADGSGGVRTSGAAADYYWMRAEATFAPPSALIPSTAKTYDMKLVPAASWIEVRQHTDEQGTKVSLKVKGLKPGHAYGAHVHQKPCGTDPMDAGGHYQNVVDPVQPSKDPKYLNPDNEIWLDFTTDKAGNAEAAAHHSWNFRRGAAASVVLHREQGGAGDRLACFTVPFGSLPHS